MFFFFGLIISLVSKHKYYRNATKYYNRTVFYKIRKKSPCGIFPLYDIRYEKRAGNKIKSYHIKLSIVYFPILKK